MDNINPLDVCVTLIDLIDLFPPHLWCQEMSSLQCHVVFCPFLISVVSFHIWPSNGVDNQTTKNRGREGGG